jgi:hypothetical protein
MPKLINDAQTMRDTEKAKGTTKVKPVEPKENKFSAVGVVKKIDARTKLMNELLNE